MQHRPHVPKFGNFESDNDVPYTAYFEKARQDKGTGVKMNPNDPEENPEAFMYTRKANTSRSSSRNNNSSNSIISVSGRSRSLQRNSSKSFASESGSFNNNSDNFASRSHGKHIRKKSNLASENGPPSQGANRHRTTSLVSDVSNASVSVPKFGAWDEKDPTPGEGFTVLFNKVKEEKQIAASKFPVVLPQVITHTKAHKEKKMKKRTKAKMCMKKWCCLFQSKTSVI